MMLPERWLVAAILGLTLSLVSMAGSVFGQRQNAAKSSSQSTASATSQAPVPAKAVPDPNAPPPPDDPAAEPPKKDDDLAPEPEPSFGAESESPKPALGGSSSNASTIPTTAEGVAPTAADAAKLTAKPEDRPTTPAVAAGSGVIIPKTPDSGKHSKWDKETVQLLSLTQELKTEVEKAGANTLSLAALRKADEIQRVARDLREKMKVQGQAIASKP
jgi:hypothetical protein